MAAPSTAEIDRFTAMARIALRHYDLLDPVAEFVHLHENLTFRVTAAAGRDRYLLRMQRPAPSNFLVPSPAALESELLWLEALSRETDIVVQQPVRNRRGRLVTTITPLGEPAPLPCTLLTWIDGGPLAQDEPSAALLASRLGQLLAKLHDHAAAWQMPRGFTRVTFGPEFLHRTVALLKAGAEENLIRPQDFAVLDETADRIRSVMSPLPRDRQTWGLIHADLQGSNILVHEGEVRPIDFSLCGFGYFQLDLAIALSCVKPHLRGPLLAGYKRRRPLPDDAMPQIEAFSLFSMLNCYAFLLPDPNARKWLSRRVPQAAANECQAFLRGERFLSIESEGTDQ